MLRRIYDWCIDAAHKPYALWIMGMVSFAESSFFPVPPDVMLIPMSLARPERAWFYAGAVHRRPRWLGGVVGYAIGALLYNSVGHWVIQFYGYGDKVEAFRAGYAEWGAWIILLKGLTPIPYKLVTITAGFAGFDVWLFILLSIIARGGRFFVVAILLNRYGVWIREQIEKRLGAVGRRSAPVRAGARASSSRSSWSDAVGGERLFRRSRSGVRCARCPTRSERATIPARSASPRR